jgi:hypothetical protein
LSCGGLRSCDKVFWVHMQVGESCDRPGPLIRDLRTWPVGPYPCLSPTSPCDHVNFLILWCWSKEAIGGVGGRFAKLWLWAAIRSENRNEILVLQTPVLRWNTNFIFFFFCLCKPCHFQI